MWALTVLLGTRSLVLTVWESATITNEVHSQQGSSIRVAYLLDADLVGNRRVLKLETLVTDLEYADDMALLANNWSDLTAMLDSLSTKSCCKKLGPTISCMKTKSLAFLPPTWGFHSGRRRDTPTYAR